ncbi:hypothetical protein [Cylindrospermopsis raciborskii]|uniref:hypothetical protein n=1 Tax=Cylindrospermopsis raciborskii TaxID=77022 RepID=UPI001177C90E|nr:hypothetical protein [Cylindrospermopsis raciborskii]NLQ05914.1 hypothetical protein [Cylindrospermopsis raciborskii MVCC19]
MLLNTPFSPGMKGGKSAIALNSLWAIALFKNSRLLSHTRKPLPHIAKSLIGKFIKNFVKNSLQI